MALNQFPGLVWKCFLNSFNAIIVDRIVLEIGAQKPGFLGKYFVATDRLDKNPVSLSESVSPIWIYSLFR